MNPDSRREKWASIYTQLKQMSGQPSNQWKGITNHIIIFVKVNHNLKHIINLKT